MNAPLHADGPEQGIVLLNLAELADEYRSHAERVRGVLKTSADAERPYLKRFFEWFGSPDSSADLFSRINADSVTHCLVDYASKYGSGSRRCMQNTVRIFLRFAYHAGYMAHDLSALSPSVRVLRMGKVARPIPAECIEMLQDSICGDTSADLRDRAIICLLSTYGVRGVQVRRLCLEDIDWTGDRIHFPAVKRSRAVEQHLTEDAGNRLAEYIRKARPSSPCREVFLHIEDPFVPIAHPRELSRIIRRRMIEAGVKLPDGVAYGSHCFRHAFASRMYGQVPFKDVVDMLGHRDPSTTLIYGKVDIANLQRAALPWPGGAR